MHWIAIVLAAAGVIGTVSSTVFLGLALIGARRFHRIAAEQKKVGATLTDAQLPFVSLLKPCLLYTSRCV